jgi:alpha-tubulin suppressor-like RCC1 family protein
VAGLEGVTAIAAGQAHTLALRSDGTVWAWGWHVNGQLGIGDCTIDDRNAPPCIDQPSPVKVLNLTGITAIAANRVYSRALKAGNVWVWGGGRGHPFQVQGLSGVIAVAAGGTHTLVLGDNGTVWAWGDNSHGQLGDGTLTGRSTPVQVGGLSGMAVAIAAGFDDSFAVLADGTVWSWGGNTDGQLGDGSRSPRTTPVQVSGFRWR